MAWLIIDYEDVKPDECIYGWCQELSRTIVQGNFTCVVFYKGEPIGEMHYHCYQLFHQQLMTRDAHHLN